MAKQKSKSRLAKVRRKRAVRAILFSLVLFVGLIFALINYGVPLLIRLAVLVSEKSGSSQSSPPEQSVILAAPVLDALPSATPSAQIRITGYGPANSTISILVNGAASNESLVPDDGSFDLKVPLSLGENIISAIAEDDQDNRSPKSQSWTVIRDTRPPTLTVTSPENNSQMSGNSKKIVTITGSTDKDSSVIINDRFTIVNSDGDFSAKFELQEGENQFTITARDPAGNETIQELTLSWNP